MNSVQGCQCAALGSLSGYLVMNQYEGIKQQESWGMLNLWKLPAVWGLTLRTSYKAYAALQPSWGTPLATLGVGSAFLGCLAAEGVSILATDIANHKGKESRFNHKVFRWINDYSAEILLISQVALNAQLYHSGQTTTALCSLATMTLGVLGARGKLPPIVSLCNRKFLPLLAGGTLLVAGNHWQKTVIALSLAKDLSTRLCAWVRDKNCPSKEIQKITDLKLFLNNSFVDLAITFSNKYMPTMIQEGFKDLSDLLASHLPRMIRVGTFIIGGPTAQIAVIAECILHTIPNPHFVI